MPAQQDAISHFTPDDVDTWYRPREIQMLLGDVLDPSNSESMSVGFAHYAPGASNEWVVTYDEALIITKGAFTVTSADGVETTAHAGEVIFLRAGTPVVYSAKDEGAEVVYVTYPHWTEAHAASEYAPFLDSFQPIEERPGRSDPVALLRSIYDPLERGESHDFGPFYDAFDENIVLTTSMGEARGKAAVTGYFSKAAETMEFDIFVRPLQYFGDGNRVVQVGRETFRVKETGKTHEADWAWVYEVEDGRITRILGIEDLSGVADEEAEALTRAQTEADLRAVPAQ
jgi:ethanolamine utilization protein EutQ